MCSWAAGWLFPLKKTHIHKTKRKEKREETKRGSGKSKASTDTETHAPTLSSIISYSSTIDTWMDESEGEKKREKKRPRAAVTKHTISQETETTRLFFYTLVTRHLSTRRPFCSFSLPHYIHYITTWAATATTNASSHRQTRTNGQTDRQTDGPRTICRLAPGTLDLALSCVWLALVLFDILI